MQRKSKNHQKWIKTKKQQNRRPLQMTVLQTNKRSFQIIKVVKTSTHFQKKSHPKNTSHIQVLKTKNTKTSTSFQKIVRVQKILVQLRVAPMKFKRNINIRNHTKKINISLLNPGIGVQEKRSKRNIHHHHRLHRQRKIQTQIRI